MIHSSNKNFTHKNKSQPTVFISKKPLRPQKVIPPVVTIQPAVPTGGIILNKKQVQEKFSTDGRRGSANSSIFDRLGTSSASTSESSGTRITISQLNRNVTINDVTELCSSIGEVKQVEIKHDRFGNPLVWSSYASL